MDPEEIEFAIRQCQEGYRTAYTEYRRLIGTGCTNLAKDQLKAARQTEQELIRLRAILTGTGTPEDSVPSTLPATLCEEDTRPWWQKIFG